MMSSPLCRVALIALDWIERRIAVDEQNARLIGCDTLQFNESMLVDALAVEFVSSDPKLIYLRDCFSEFCDQVMILSSMNAKGLLLIEDIAPYLGYYAERLLERRGIRSKAVNKALRAFVGKYYDQEELLAFLRAILAEYNKPRGSKALAQDGRDLAPTG